MSLTDDLKRMKKKGRQVVSIDYVLRHLEESQKNDCPNCTQIAVYTMDSFPRASQDVVGGGVSER